MALLTCQNISLAYERHTVLSELSFQVHAGDYLCIIGENGSGKSSLIKAILGLIPTVNGTISLGEELSKHEIAYLPQQNAAQKDFPASVYEVVLSGRLSSKRFFSFYSRKDKQGAEANMERLGVLSLKDKSFRELSGGQQQRVLLARAFSTDMKLLIVDEPTVGLDAYATAELYRMIAEINASGVAVIMVTHDVEAAKKYATHILYLQNKPLFFGSKKDYFSGNHGESEENRDNA